MTPPGPALLGSEDDNDRDWQSESTGRTYLAGRLDATTWLASWQKHGGGHRLLNLAANASTTNKINYRPSDSLW